MRGAWALVGGLLALAGCAPTGEAPAGAGVPAGVAPPPGAPLAIPGAGERVKVVVLGDSLAAGYRLALEEAFPARLGEQLAAAGQAVEVVNAGVSGDTTAGGLARLDWILRQQPDLVLVELGANDGLRGIPPAATEANLRQILGRIRAAGSEAALLAMRLPPSYGPEHVAAFEAIFPRVASDLDVRLVPFFLEGVAGRPELNLPDGIHPNAEGQRRAAANLLPHVAAAVAELAARTAPAPAAAGAQ